MNCETINNTPLIQVPLYVKAYVYKRSTEVVEYLDAKDFRLLVNKHELTENEKDDSFLSNRRGMTLEILYRELGIRKCLIKYPLKATTVLRNEMLKYAAYLEYQTYAVHRPLSIEAARYALVDDYPQTNCTRAYPESCLLLIRENNGCYKLPFHQFQKLKDERKQTRITEGLNLA